jgi:hypothetical protein
MRRSPAAAARAIERARPDFRNLVITAEELIAHPDRAQPWVRERVFADAARAFEEYRPGGAAPLVRPVLAALAGVAVFVTAALLGSSEFRAIASKIASATPLGRVLSRETAFDVVARITPPAYLQRGEERVRNPERIEAISGSRLQLEVPNGAKVRFGDVALSSGKTQRGDSVEMTLRDSGYLAISSADGAVSRLVPVTVNPDRLPLVAVRAPAKDLLLPDARTDVRLEAAATDDHALTAMSLRYTKVSGSGEQFEFVEGELPIDIVRRDPREWAARGEFPLSRLALEPGDSLVYRVIARDARSGDDGLGASDTYFIEIAGPGQVALEGFEMPPERERYALSQQMIVLKIERLRARERSLARDAVADQTAGIAAEQRSVRANFVFLMGGHVEDEEEEAEQSHEIQEGRLENTARREISVAINHMGRTEGSLTAVDTATALKEAKLAVDALQRAFGKNRYLLRTLPVRSRVDPSRRLSGTLDEASDWQRTTVAQDPNDRSQATATLLTAVADASRRARASASPRRDEAAELSERALRIDPASADWQRISRQLAEQRWDAATRAIAEIARRQALQGGIDLRATPARRAWAAEQRR